MPPALSEDEVSDVAGDIGMPLRPLSPASGDDDDAFDATNDDAPLDDAEEEEDDEEDEDGDSELYVVEKISQHMIDDGGNIKFHVKWEGYSKKADMTWEPEENLAESATEILQDYYASIGGRDAAFEESHTAAKGKKRGRQSAGAASATKRTKKNASHPATSAPPATKKWSPPSGSWEDEIESVDACESENSGKLMVFLNWKNGHKTKHDTSVVYKKCPQKMLAYYEQHVRIIREENQVLKEGEAN